MAWRTDYWNYIDVVTIVSTWAVITRRGVESGYFTYQALVTLAVLLLFVKIFKFFYELGLKVSVRAREASSGEGSELG